MATIKKKAVLATGVKHDSSVESVIDMHIYLVSCLKLVRVTRGVYCFVYMLRFKGN